MSGATEEPFDASNAEHVRDRGRKAKRVERERESVLGALMEQAPGRAWLWGMLEQCGVFRTSFALNGLEMARREGERNVGLRLLADIHRIAPERYPDMLKEAQDG